MPASVSTDIHASDSCQVLLGAVSCACLCVKELRAFDAFNALVLSTTNNLISTLSVSLLLRCWRLALRSSCLQDMKLGQQTR